MNTHSHKMLQPYTLPGLLRRNAQLFPQNEGVVSQKHNVRWNWKEFDHRTDEVARGLYSMGIRKGDHIAVWATNVPEWMLIMFGAAKLGAILVTINTNLKHAELNYLLSQSDTKMLVMLDGIKGNDYISHITDIAPALLTSEPDAISCEQLPCLKTVILIGDHPNKPKGMYAFSDIYQKAEQTDQDIVEKCINELDPHDTVTIMYTSGTTGFPKGVVLSHFKISNNGQFTGDCMNLTPEDRLMLVVPLFHCYGYMGGVMGCITHGTTIVLLEKYNPLKAMMLIESERCTAVHGVPTMFIGMIEHPDFEKFDFSSMRTGTMGGSPCPIKLTQDIIDKMHIPEMLICYGQTESSSNITMGSTDEPLERRISTVGRVMPNAEAKIVNLETGEICPPGIPGEIMTRGYHVMDGYYKMPEATSQAIDKDGWLHTGDIGTMDESGHYHITGRLKDMIIRGGENVYPREIEEYIYEHPAILDVQVVGVPDKKYGEEICACIIRKEGCEVTEDELIEFVRSGLSRFKVPRYVLFMESYPLTASRKVSKRLLRDVCAQLLNLKEIGAIETA